MKNKIFLIIPLLILLTGCTVNYNLEINKDSITENISGTVTNEEITPEIEGRSDVNPKYYYLYLADNVLFNDNTAKYNKNITDIQDGKKFNFNYTYKNNYDKSMIINSCFENHKIIETDTYYSIELTGSFSCLYSNKIDINITSNYMVLENNAKKVEDNKYTWEITDSENVNIKLVVSKENKYEEPAKAKMFSTFQIIGFVVFAILTIITYFLYKKKNSGKI